MLWVMLCFGLILIAFIVGAVGVIHLRDFGGWLADCFNEEA